MKVRCANTVAPRLARFSYVLLGLTAAYYPPFAAAVTDAMEPALAEGLVASPCRIVDDETAVYLLRPKGAE